MLDPDVVLRDAREFLQARKGAAEIAHRFAALGPSFARLCHPATINGQAGVLVETAEGIAGVIGFTIRGGLITTIAVSLNPDKLQSLTSVADARPPDLPTASKWRPSRKGPGTLAHAQAQPPSGSSRKRWGWPGVYRQTGHVGAVADVPLPPTLKGQLLEERPALERESGWVTLPLNSKEAVQHTLALLRSHYEHAQAGKRPGRRTGPT